MEKMILDGAPIEFPLSESAVNMATIRALIESATHGKLVTVDA